jgi:superfamily I DNA/RNA helicase
VPWDDGLEGAAREFAAAEEAAVRALAGPGTGKTFALLRRTARLLEEGCPANRLLVLTFARTAAQDLVRALQGIEGGAAEEVRVGTLHSFCFSLLGRERVLAATGRAPRILLEFERNLLVLDLEGAFPPGIRERDELRRAFEAAWARLQTDAPGEPIAGLDQSFQDALLASLRWHKAMLIGEVVPIALSYLRNNPQAPERSAFLHVLVDEYQDLNRAEQAVVDLLSGETNVAVIGDDDQSIYSFKWANPEGIRNFDGDHPGTHDVQFTECRRCPARVVTMAQTLIQRNPGRLRAALHASPGNPLGEIHHVQWTSVEDEAAGIAEFVAYHVLTRGVDPGSCLILAPSRRVGYAIRDAIRGRGVPIHSFFREEAVESEAAQRAVTLLTLLARPEDRVALRAWLSFGSTTDRRGPYRRIVRAAQERNCDAADVLRLIQPGELRLPHTGTLVPPWEELQERLAELEPLRDMLPALVNALIPAPPDPGNEDDFALLRALADALLDETDDLRDFAEMLRYRVAQPEVPLETPYARVMSLHKSKGLTADLVVVAGLVEGMLPRVDHDAAPAEQQAQLEEQRRLFFVGITRTRNVLVLSSYSALDFATAMRLGARIGARLTFGQNPRHRVFASTFLGELGDELPQAVRGQDWHYA